MSDLSDFLESLDLNPSEIASLKKQIEEGQVEAAQRAVSNAAKLRAQRDLDALLDEPGVRVDPATYLHIALDRPKKRRK